MQRGLASGLSAGQAAESALAGPTSADPVAGALDDSCARLEEALLAYDETEAHAVLDRLLAGFATATVLTEAVLPCLRSIGDRWAAGTVTIAQEHYASNVLRGRLLGLARGWGQGIGPIALLACPPDERHDLPLIMFGIALRQAGWRITFLGADTPIATIEAAALSVGPRAVVLSAVVPRRFAAVESTIAPLGKQMTIAIGGAGARAELASRIGAVLLEGDPVAAGADFGWRGQS